MSGPTGAELAARAASEKALDEALVDLESAHAEAARLRREGAARRASAEAAAAAAALARGRVAALEAEAGVSAETLVAREAEVARRGEEIARLEAELAEARDPLPGWLEDAASDDGGRRAAARRAVGGATDEQIARLAAFLAEDASSRAGAVAVLVGGLPEGEAKAGLARRILLAEDASAASHARVASVGEAALRVYAVARPVLTTGAPGVVDEVVGRLAGRDLAWSEAERVALAQALTEPSIVDPARLRAVGVLALAGVADRLAELCAHDDVATRTAAAHALSRVPDRDAVRPIAFAFLSMLLGDEDLRVRTAGVLLAEAYLGGAAAFDPSAGPAERRVARDAILDRLERLE